MVPTLSIGNTDSRNPIIIMVNMVNDYKNSLTKMGDNAHFFARPHDLLRFYRLT